MKKIRIFALMGAVALTSALAFTSCKNDKNDLTTQSGPKEEVKTEFSISIPTTQSSVSKAPRRMRDANVQVTTGAFNGMKDITLIPYATAGSIQPTDTRLGAPIAISTTLGTGELDVVNTNDNKKSHLYENVSIPIGTSSFLFYAKANTAANLSLDAGIEDEFEVGKTKVVNGSDVEIALSDVTTPNGLFFAPAAITSDAYPTSAVGTAILTYMNAIAHAQTGGVYWKNAANEGLQDLYKVFVGQTKATNQYYQAGASVNIKRTVQDLYKLIYLNSDPMSIAIRDSIFTKAADSNTDGVLEWSDASLDGFPANVKLPDGSACLHFDNDGATPDACEFSFVNAGLPKFSSFLTAANKFCYPAELLYGVNSTIVTATSSKKSAYTGYSAGSTTWAAFLTSTYNEGLTSVSNRTRSVAIANAINYGVGRFDVRVKLANSDFLADAESTNIPIVTSEGATQNGLTLTGVLVGSQGKVDYMFHPVAAGTNVIYDKDVYGITALRDTYSDYNRTLVYETDVPAGGDASIYFALEFLNNTGKDFVGADGIVPVGAHFYLVGKLNMTKEASHADGQDINKIFQQDFYTIANCTVSGLDKAVNTIPDLREPKMELGLSVDLEWQAGHTFEVTTWE